MCLDGERQKPDRAEGHADPLTRSAAIQDSASARGFDWPDISGVLAKVREEIGEVEHAWSSMDLESAKRELGDLLFAAVNLGRFLQADPSEELDRANARFEERFALLHEELQRTGRAMEKCTLDELDEVWERVKERLRAERPPKN